MPILEGLCTLREVQEYYSIDDIADMNEALMLKHKYSQPKEELRAKPIVIDGGVRCP